MRKLVEETETASPKGESKADRIGDAVLTVDNVDKKISERL